jgi:hypothetical protein
MYFADNWFDFQGRASGHKKHRTTQAKQIAGYKFLPQVGFEFKIPLLQGLTVRRALDSTMTEKHLSKIEN